MARKCFHNCTSEFARTGGIGNTELFFFRFCDFLDLFADKPVRINPILFAMEGNTRDMPTSDLVHRQLEEVVTKLKKALPRAEMVVGPRSLEGALGLIEESALGFQRKRAFLLRLAPNLAAPISRQNAQRRWSEVIAAADDCGVARGSLVVLAALSSVVVPNGRSPAKKLLKLKRGSPRPMPTTRWRIYAR